MALHLFLLASVLLLVSGDEAQPQPSLPSPAPTTAAYPCDPEQEANLRCLDAYNLSAEACIECYGAYFDNVTAANQTCGDLAPLACTRIETCSRPCPAAETTTAECGCGSCAEEALRLLECELAALDPAGCELPCAAADAASPTSAPDSGSSPASGADLRGGYRRRPTALFSAAAAGAFVVAVVVALPATTMNALL